jgi:hypothetical protein
MKNEQRNKMFEIIKETIKKNQTVERSSTSMQIANEVQRHLAINVSRDTIRYAIRKLVDRGEKILSFRNGDLRGYRYPKGKSDYDRYIEEQRVMVNAFSNRKNKAEEESEHLSWDSSL